jgi:hypothetical protein
MDGPANRIGLVTSDRDSVLAISSLLAAMQTHDRLRVTDHKCSRTVMEFEAVSMRERIELDRQRPHTTSVFALAIRA